MLLPHITEKANDLVQNQGYVFEIKGRANKTMVAQEIEKKFKVKVRKVNIIASHSKPISYKRKKQSYKKSPKKAVVYLKEGYKIDLS
ncbi:MAG TPA: 50S ribosomal protein L23 [Candidatus Paceibacterota bacterium]|nr:50S ribosomal protein L23 [Candidatus Paceibacterota bacterium]HRS47662.1 50S ribosomal protein L23 [Candidatus Paceibacterota bacterium]